MATAALYGRVFLSAFNKEIDVDSDALRYTLHTSTYVPDQDTHQYKSSLTGELAAGGGYSTNGVALTSVTITYTAATNKISIDAADPSWGPGATLSGIRYGVIHDSTPATDATRPLICYHNFTTDQSVSNGTFTVQFNAAGFVEITVGAEA